MFRNSKFTYLNFHLTAHPTFISMPVKYKRFLWAQKQLKKKTFLS